MVNLSVTSTEEFRDRVMELIRENRSNYEIARIMNVTPNVIAGLVYRLRRRQESLGQVFPTRTQTFIAKSAEERISEKPRPGASRSAAALMMTEKAGGHAKSSAEISKPLDEPAKQQEPPLVCSEPRVSRRQCTFPIGTPRTPGFHFCSAEAFGNKPYCPEHIAIAYVEIGKGRREDAA